MPANSYRKGAIPYGFVAVPKDMLKRPEYQALPSAAKSLMFDLADQYSGKNNGRLCPSFEAMRRYGWTSKSKLVRAKAELLKCPFVIQTRIGHPPRTAEWLGLTWWKLDWGEGMEIRPQGWPYLNFATAIPVVPKQDRWSAKSAPGGSDSGPMKGRIRTSSVPNQDHATEVRVGKAIGPESGEVLELAISTAAQEGVTYKGIKLTKEQAAKLALQRSSSAGDSPCPN